MRIAVISPFFHQGGAGRAAGRLADGCASLPGVEVLRFTPWNSPGCINFGQPSHLTVAAQEVLHACGSAGRRRAWSMQSRRYVRTLVRLCTEQRAEAIHLHGFNQWDQMHVRLDMAASLAQVAPVVWTLHDGWPLNGRIDYPGLPDRATSWTSEALESVMTQGLQETAPGWPDQLAAVRRARRFAFVAPSAWLTGHARRACGPDVRCETIANAVDAAVFRPHDRVAARAALGWPAERTILLMAASDWGARRKGAALWLDAAPRIRAPYDLAVVGGGGSAALARGPVQVHALGSVGDDRLLALAYSAADIVVVPSLLDNLPNILLEALACGTPCVCFRAGGIPEVIRSGETGSVAAEVSGPALAAAVDGLLESLSLNRAAWRDRCVAYARAHYDPAAQAGKYLRLFEELRHVQA